MSKLIKKNLAFIKLEQHIIRRVFARTERPQALKSVS